MSASPYAQALGARVHAIQEGELWNPEQSNFISPWHVRGHMTGTLGAVIYAIGDDPTRIVDYVTGETWGTRVDARITAFSVANPLLDAAPPGGWVFTPFTSGALGVLAAIWRSYRAGHMTPEIEAVRDSLCESLDILMWVEPGHEQDAAVVLPGTKLYVDGKWRSMTARYASALMVQQVAEAAKLGIVP